MICSYHTMSSLIFSRDRRNWVRKLKNHFNAPQRNCNMSWNIWVICEVKSAMKSNHFQSNFCGWSILNQEKLSFFWSQNSDWTSSSFVSFVTGVWTSMTHEIWQSLSVGSQWPFQGVDLGRLSADSCEACLVYIQYSHMVWLQMQIPFICSNNSSLLWYQSSSPSVPRERPTFVS